MRFLLSAMVLIMASAAGAQSLTVTVTGADDADDVTDNVITTKQCGQTYTVHWQLNAQLNPSTCDLKVWVAKGTNCGSMPEDNATDKRIIDGVPDEWETVLQGDLDLLVEKDKGGTDYSTKFPQLTCDPNTKEDLKFSVCGAFKMLDGLGNCGSAIAAIAPIYQIHYDTTPPAKPAIDKITALDSALSVSMKAQDGVTDFLANIKGADGSERKDVSFDKKSTLRIGGLTNKVEYTVSVYAEDAVKNRSEISDSVKETPVQTDGFIERYQLMNGGETGGCAVSAGGSLLSLIGLLPLLARRSRRR
jgi:hypothetical protein